MKKLLLSSFLTLATVFAFAQNDISVTLDSPTANANLTEGTAFTFEITVTNTGTVPIAATDTILYAPTFGGSLLGTTGGGSLVYSAQQAIAAGASFTFSQQLNITGGADGAIGVCGLALVLGPNWSNVTEDDTTNNSDCVTINWSTNSVGNEEFALAELKDNSFYNNGVYAVRLANATSFGSMDFELISITGQVVQSTTFSVSGSEVYEDIQLNVPSTGVYIARLTSNGQPVSARKIIVQ